MPCQVTWEILQARVVGLAFADCRGRLIFLCFVSPQLLRFGNVLEHQSPFPDITSVEAVRLLRCALSSRLSRQRAIPSPFPPTGSQLL